MTLKTLIAGISREESAGAVIDVAAELAEQHQAHLTGLHVVPSLAVYVSAEMALPADVIQARDDEDKRRTERLKAQFEELTAHRELVAEWRSLNDTTVSVADSMIEMGGTTDLMVVGRGAVDSAGRVMREIPEHVIAHSHRPVLVVPDQYRVKTLGRTVFVAWDGGRESTRAVFDSLPILQTADAVRLHRINQSHEDRHHIVGMTEALASTLARHGVNVEVSHADASFGEVANDILRSARDIAADMLVMGAYGHSRLREFLLGSTTRTVLREMTVPVVMAH